MEVFREEQCELLYGIILENTDVGILICDHRGNILESNEKSLYFFGVHEKKSLNNINLFNYQPFIDAGISDDLYKAYNECIKIVNTKEFFTAWKSDFYLKYFIYPVNIKGNKYAKIILKDYTKTRKKEEKIKKLKEAVEKVEEVIVITDREANITYVNPAFTKITGYTYEEVLGKNPRILKSGLQNREFYEDLWNVILNKKSWKGIFWNKKKDGSLYQELVTITPIVDEDEEITDFIAVKRDITEEMKMQKQLLEAQKMEGLGILASGIAHEINTPLQYILDNLLFVKENFRELKKYRKFIHEKLNITPEIKEYQEKIDMDYVISEIPQALDDSLKGVEIIKNIINSMRLFSYHGEGKQIIDNINKYILAAVEISRNYWKNILKVTFKLSENLPKVKINTGKINQVLLNLIINAVDAVKEDKTDKKEHEIIISSYQKGKFLVISVKDNGIGIKEENQDKIFNPFFTTKEVGKGTGQGLSISYDIIVKEHSGKLYFESEYGKGTTFYLELPIIKEI